MNITPQQQRRRNAFANYLERWMVKHPERFDYGTLIDNPTPKIEHFTDLATGRDCGTVGCIAGHYIAKFYPKSTVLGTLFSDACFLMHRDMGFTYPDLARLTEPDGCYSIPYERMGPLDRFDFLRDIVEVVVAYLRDSTKKPKDNWLMQLRRKHSLIPRRRRVGTSQW